jgi:hypothetical protein
VAGRHISFCVVSLRPFWITRRPPLIFLMKKNHQIYRGRCMGFGSRLAFAVFAPRFDKHAPLMRRVLTRAADRIATRIL